MGEDDENRKAEEVRRKSAGRRDGDGQEPVVWERQKTRLG